MKIILDTHIFLWALAEPVKISSDRRRMIETRANRVYVSSISIAELMIKSSIGKIDVNFDPVESAEKCGFELLSYTAEDAALLKDLPFHHRDPFDRMLITQSLNNGHRLMSDDAKFNLYDCELI